MVGNVTGGLLSLDEFCTLSPVDCHEFQPIHGTGKKLFHQLFGGPEEDTSVVPFEAAKIKCEKRLPGVLKSYSSAASSWKEVKNGGSDMR
jgi:hypothetical protein